MDESLLEQALLETMDEMLFGEEFDIQLPPFVPSEKFQKKILKLQNNYNKPGFKLFHSRSKRAVIVLVAILILLLSTLSVGAVREAISKFFVTHFSNHAVVDFDENYDTSKTCPETIETVYGIDVPEGFEPLDSSITDNDVTFIYLRDDYAQIAFVQSLKKDYKMYTDNEHSTQSHETIDGQEYLINKDEINQSYAFIWDNGEYVFHLRTSNLSKEETLKICQSLKKFKN